MYKESVELAGAEPAGGAEIDEWEVRAIGCWRENCQVTAAVAANSSITRNLVRGCVFENR
jgi:hypothetical protein